MVKININKETKMSALITAIMMVIIVICFDITYCLNDDMMIQSVVSGTFSGRASAFAYYLSVPLAFILSVLYSIIPAINWFGVFLVGSMFFCIFLIIKRVLGFREEKSSRLYLGTVAIISITGLVIPQIVLVHYTVVAAFLGATGIFLFVCNISCQNDFRVRSNISSIVCVILCYLTRENVFYMMVPFAMVAIVFAIVYREGKITESIKRVLPFLLTVVISFLIAFGINKIPYMNGELKEYVKFNEDRTKLYDYVGVRSNPEALDYYNSCNISDKDVELFKSYNIMLADDNLKDETYSMGEYTDSILLDKGSRLKNAVYMYKESLIKRDNYYPYNYVIIALYIIMALMIIKYKRWTIFIPLLLSFGVRTLLFLYLFYKGRFPERVTYSLMLMEIVLILSMLLVLSKAAKKYSLSRMLPMLTCLALLVCGYYSLPRMASQYEKQVSVNDNDDVVYSYIRDNSDNFYFLDVYMTVNRTEKVFKSYDASTENYLVLGGWITGHPLVGEKLRNAQLPDDVRTAIFEDRSYIILSDEVGWQQQDFEEYIGCTLSLCDTISDQKGRNFNVYKCIR